MRKRCGEFSADVRQDDAELKIVRRSTPLLRYPPNVCGTPTLGLYQPRALCAVASHLLPTRRPPAVADTEKCRQRELCASRRVTPAGSKNAAIRNLARLTHKRLENPRWPFLFVCVVDGILSGWACCHTFTASRCRSGSTYGISRLVVLWKETITFTTPSCLG